MPDWFEENAARAPAAPPVRPPSPQEGAGALGFVWNIPKSTAGLARPFLHPVETAEGIGNLAMGLTEELGGPSAKIGSGHTQYVTALGQALKDRYGGWEAIKKTAYDDPAGFVADVSAILSLGAGGLRGVARLARGGPALAGTTELRPVPTLLERTATGVGKASEFTNPAMLVGKPVKAVAGFAGRGAAELLGVTSGEGAQAIRTGWARLSTGGTAALPFKNVMRRKLTELDILQDFREPVQNIRNQRAARYQDQLRDMSQNATPLELAPVRQQLTKELERFNVREVPATGPSPELQRLSVSQAGKKFELLTAEQQQGLRELAERLGMPSEVTTGTKLDLSRVPIANPSERALFENIVHDIQTWGSQPGDLTPLGVDALKRRVADFYTSSSQARAFVQRMKEHIRNLLDTEVPGYRQMTADYAKASELVESIEAELSLGVKANPGAAIRKLSYALKQNNEYRKILVEALEQYAPADLMGELAGFHLRGIVPRGLTGRLIAVGLTGAAIKGSITPMLLVDVLATSPRAIGESMVLLSAAVRAGRPLARAAMEPAVYRGLTAAYGAQQRVQIAGGLPPVPGTKVFPQAMLAGFASENGISAEEARKSLAEQGYTVQ